MPTNVEINEDGLGHESDIGGDKADVEGDEADAGGGDEADMHGGGDQADVGGDSDVELVDDEHIIEPVDVPMEGFRFNLDSDDERERDTTVVQFQKGMDELKAYNIKAYEWLQKIPAEHWSRSHFSGRAHCDLLINNICEVFNRQLLDARDSPIITALEYVREYLLKRIVVVQSVIDKSVGPLTPSVTKILDIIKTAATQYTAQWNGADKYEVKGPWGDQLVVNLEQKTCSCRKWEISGLPCKHVVACINNLNENGGNGGLAEDWVHPSYRLNTWKEQYSHKINPICGKHLWVKHEWPSTLIPPKEHPQIGRPPKKRKKSVVELEDLVKGGKLSRKGTTMTCSICKEKGHNRRSCNRSSVGNKQSAGGSAGGGRNAGASGSKQSECGSQHQQAAAIGSQQHASATPK